MGYSGVLDCQQHRDNVCPETILCAQFYGLSTVYFIILYRARSMHFIYS